MQDNEKRERLIVEGIVVDSNRGKFRIELDGGTLILCVLSGKIKQSNIKIVVGDLVRCEISEYDMTKGRIVYRIKGN